ncbi:hypothetical protein BJF85_15605 [Saccharomonospora sp. CUA-673]|nr:hypothetical protein BJF85_15605 [Saccharomonospora sp. CUA-673]
MTAPRRDEAPHLEAIKRSAEAGFRFLHVREAAGGAVTAIHAERKHRGVVETFLLQDVSDAVAARFRSEDYPSGDPVWQEHGTVADVIAALLSLPPPGAPGAPTRKRRVSRSLWMPDGSR